MEVEKKEQSVRVLSFKIQGGKGKKNSKKNYKTFPEGETIKRRQLRERKQQPDSQLLKERLERE